MNKQELVKKAEEEGWEVAETTNLHLTKNGTSVLVETFDGDGNPCLYAMNSAAVGHVAVGGNIETPGEADNVADVLDQADRIVNI